MKLLSIIAFATAFFYGIIVYKRTRAKIDQELLFSVLVCISLGWWAFCDALFYSADTKAGAWIFHRIGAFGWCGFIGVTGWYFLVLAGLNKKLPLWFKVLYWGVSAGLTMRFVLFQPSALAEDLIQSTLGMGWTFVQTYHTIWPFLFLLYLFVCLGGALFYIFLWEKREEKASVRHLAKGFVVLDIIAVSIGIITIFVIPYFTHEIPPMASIALLIFLWGYCMELWEYDIYHVELVLDPQLILDSSLEPMMITDEGFRILYCNRSMKQLLHDNKLLNRTVMDFLPVEEREIFINPHNLEKRSIQNIAINLLEGKAALMSINKVHTRKHSQLLFIISMHDISRIKQSQIQMEHMAYYDDLTGLANRRKLGELLDEWETECNKKDKDFVLVFLDLNDFKVINDRYGHDAGDQALVMTSQVLQNTLSENDESFRLSGDEFVILHIMQKGESVDEIIENFKQEISAANINDFAPNMQLDASIGACLYSEYKDVHQMMKIADERMYLMKQEYHEK